MKIPIASPVIGDEEVDLAVKVLRSGWLVQGPMVKAFEEELSKYIGVKHVVAVSSGTAALDVALKCLRIGPGDEVIVPDFTFIATANAVLYQGARPVFADIELETYTMDPEDVQEKITKRTKAVIAVHLYGHPCRMKELKEICMDHGIALIEDAAQALGSEYMGRKAGSLGDIAAFSFYATKNITTAGEGGAIATDDDRAAEYARMLRDQGQKAKYEHVILGYNYRMTEVQAAVGLVQLRKIDLLIEARRRNAELLTRLLKNVPGIKTPIEKPWAKHTWHQYVVWVDEEEAGLTRDQLAEELRKRGVGVAVHYPKPIHMQPLYRQLGYPEDLCPNSLEASKHVLSLPVHPLLSEQDINYIAEAVREAVEGRRP